MANKDAPIRLFQHKWPMQNSFFYYLTTILTSCKQLGGRECLCDWGGAKPYICSGSKGNVLYHTWETVSPPMGRTSLWIANCSSVVHRLHHFYMTAKVRFLYNKIINIVHNSANSAVLHMLHNSLLCDDILEQDNVHITYCCGIFR